MDSGFHERLADLEARIDAALQKAGRHRSQITLVAVTKKFSADRIREAYQVGLRNFGENYVQEFAGKAPRLTDLADAKYHLIGHLQSNKAAQATNLFQYVQTADSGKLLKRLDKAASDAGRRTQILLEIKLSSEESKIGANPSDLPGLIATAAECPNLDVTGLMTVPPWSENPQSSRPYFRKLADLAKEYSLQDLSMGMSNDFEVALEEGATLIRVGTALFGPRPKPQETGG